MPKKLMDCVEQVKQQGREESSAFAICVASTGQKPHKKAKKLYKYGYLQPDGSIKKPGLGKADHVADPGMMDATAGMGTWIMGKSQILEELIMRYNGEREIGEMIYQLSKGRKPAPFGTISKDGKHKKAAKGWTLIAGNTGRGRGRPKKDVTETTPSVIKPKEEEPKVETKPKEEPKVEETKPKEEIKITSYRRKEKVDFKLKTRAKDNFREKIQEWADKHGFDIRNDKEQSEEKRSRFGVSDREIRRLEIKVGGEYYAVTMTKKSQKPRSKKPPSYNLDTVIAINDDVKIYPNESGVSADNVFNNLQEGAQDIDLLRDEKGEHILDKKLEEVVSKERPALTKSIEKREQSSAKNEKERVKRFIKDTPQFVKETDGKKYFNLNAYDSFQIKDQIASGHYGYGHREQRPPGADYRPKYIENIYGKGIPVDGDMFIKDKDEKIKKGAVREANALLRHYKEKIHSKMTALSRLVGPPNSVKDKAVRTSSGVFEAELLMEWKSGASF